MDVDIKNMIYSMVMYYLIYMLDNGALGRSLILHANLLAAVACHLYARTICAPQ